MAFIKRDEHKTMIHCKCPLRCWDYYEVTYSPDAFMRIEDFQSACDVLRGTDAFQEHVADSLALKLRPGRLTITGRHGANTETTCTRIISE